jgi:hypothetical protein
MKKRAVCVEWTVVPEDIMDDVLARLTEIFE